MKYRNVEIVNLHFCLCFWILKLVCFMLRDCFYDISKLLFSYVFCFLTFTVVVVCTVFLFECLSCFFWNLKFQFWITAKPKFVFGFVEILHSTFGSHPRLFFRLLFVDNLNSNFGHLQARLRFLSNTHEFEFGSPPSTILLFLLFLEIQNRSWVTYKPGFVFFVVIEFEVRSHPRRFSLFDCVGKF